MYQVEDSRTAVERQVGPCCKGTEEIGGQRCQASQGVQELFTEVAECQGLICCGPQRMGHSKDSERWWQGVYRGQGRKGLNVCLQEPEGSGEAQASASRRLAGNWAPPWRERMESQTGLGGSTDFGSPLRKK